MNASFEEKSVWIQLVGTVVVLGGYFAVAGRMLSSGITALPAFVPVFIVAVVLMAAVLVAGHILAAVAGVALKSPPEPRDERDRLIGWRAESNSSWLLAVGVICAITGLVLSIDGVWIAHGLLVFLFLAQVLSYILRLVYYHRGI